MGLTTYLPLCLLAVILLARPAHAFGAGNIASLSKIEGTNWRHGDIEDALLGLITARALGRNKKFSKLDVARVYFGNWLRDYSQAVDVGTVKYVSAEAINLLLWILGFLTFGYGSGEFEVTSERLGCYRPEEHIDNPKDYAENEDARQYDRRLREPVDEERELSIDGLTGLKNYIAAENLGITTSAGMLRHLFGRSIELGRRYSDSDDKADFYEALRLLGTGLHCLEDYSAHSNFIELALIEMGEREVFPHVGRNTRMELRDLDHAVYPIVTGTFGGVDFLHSVMGEFNDKATQSELEGLEETIQNSQNADTSMLKDLLDKLPSGLLGGGDDKQKADELQEHSAAAQMQNTSISPKEPEAFTQQMQDMHKQIYPIIEWHDNLMKRISEAIEKIPVLPDLIENLQDQLNLFVFSLIAPFILPVINQVKEELNTGSSEIIQSSQEQQLVVFRDDDSTNPTHSMLSKDHFSNVLNEPAGKIASAVVKWVVPQIVQAWDDPDIDINRTNDRIIKAVFHHPAKRQYGRDGAADGRAVMFQAVEHWWSEQSDDARDELRDKLSRDGVEEGRNHKEGVADSGHGCGKPLKMARLGGDSGSRGSGGSGGGSSSQIEEAVGKAAGGGALGGVLGGLAGAVGGSLLGGAFGGDKSKSKYEKHEESEGSYTSGAMEAGRASGGYGQSERYGQAEMSSTQYASGGHREEYQRYEQDGSSGRTGYGYQQATEVKPTYSGGYEERMERRYERPGGTYEQDVYAQGVESSGDRYARTEHHHGRRRSGSGSGKSDSGSGSGSGSEDDWEKKEKKRRKKEEKRLRKMRERGEYGGASADYGSEQPSYGASGYTSGDYGRREGGYEQSSYSGGGGGYSGGGRESGYSGGGYEQSSYSGGGGGYGGGHSNSGYEQSGYSGGGHSGYGGGVGGYEGQSSYGGDDSYGGQPPPPPRESGYGGGGYGQSGYGGGGYDQSGGYGGGGEGYQQGGGGYQQGGGGYQQGGGYGGGEGYGSGGYGGGGYGGGY